MQVHHFSIDLNMKSCENWLCRLLLCLERATPHHRDWIGLCQPPTELLASGWWNFLQQCKLYCLLENWHCDCHLPGANTTTSKCWIKESHERNRKSAQVELKFLFLLLQAPFAWKCHIRWHITVAERLDWESGFQQQVPVLMLDGLGQATPDTYLF